MFNWEKNVKIFTENVEIVKDDKVHIYGYGFNNFEMNLNQLEKIEIEDKNKINILVTHGDVEQNSIYNPIDKKVLQKKEFSYIALGHLHKRDEFYPGSLISLGFDETGKHGFYYGEINSLSGKYFLNKLFVKADERELIIEEINVTNILSKEELIEKLNSIQTENSYYEIVLTGYRNFEIDINIKLLQKNIIKVKNKTKYKVSNEPSEKSISGIFATLAKKRLEEKEIDEEEYEQIMELFNRVWQ